ncbi:MAG: efflux RND transporter periplasmic adaptor subunit [Muribaculaceae bacterium]
MDRPISEDVKKSRRKKAMMKWGGVAAMVVMLAILLPLFMRKSVNRSSIVITDVDRGTIATSLSASGRVEPAFEQVIVSPISTRIMEVYCVPGDSLQAGTPIMLLDLSDTQTSLSKAADQQRLKQIEIDRKKLDNSTSLSDLEMKIRVKEMEVNSLQVSLENERYLDSIGSGTGERVREAEMKLETEKLQLQQLRAQLENSRKVADASINSSNVELAILSRDLGDMQRKMDDAKIKSPRNAVLTFINDQVGAQINAGEHIATIADLSHFRLKGELAEGYLDRVGTGSKVVVKVGKTSLEGIITNISPNAKDGLVTFIVSLTESDAPCLRSGLKADINVLSDVIEDAVRIRRFPDYKKPGKYWVYVLTSDDTLTKTEVTLGESNWEYVEVISGLKPGDKVVTSDISKFNNNKNITVK